MGTRHAVVIGASVAGITAAQALADRFAAVTVVDRDELPADPEPRRGAPQGNHPHVLLAAGQIALGELFPGFFDELVAAGAIPFEPGTEFGWHRFDVLWKKVDTGVKLISFSRPLLEGILRDRVSVRPNVTVRSGVAVAALTGDSGRVTGVVLDDGSSLDADLVVDASGRSGRSDRWLGDLGFPAPEMVEVKIGVGYATKVYKRTDFLAEGVGIFILPNPPRKRAGLILPIEGDRWLVSMGGWHGEYPRNEEEFQRYARELPYPAVADLIASGQALTEVTTHGFPTSRRRYFEKLKSVPAGYVATGDAVCSFNPIYGQGMTCAALDAQALGRMLDKHGDASSTMARDFYREVATVLSVPWRFAVGGDFNFAETTGPKPFGIKLLNAYSLRVQRACAVDAQVRRVFTAVQHLITPPGALFKPSMVAKVFKASRS